MQDIAVEKVTELNLIRDTISTRRLTSMSSWILWSGSETFP